MRERLSWLASVAPAPFLAVPCVAASLTTDLTLLPFRDAESLGRRHAPRAILPGRAAPALAAGRARRALVPTLHALGAAAERVAEAEGEGVASAAGGPLLHELRVAGHQ